MYKRQIEGPAGLEDKLPFKKAGVNVMVVPDVTPYKKRKVRILNGAHTGFVPVSYTHLLCAQPQALCRRSAAG